jgi:hypothetical protein
MNMKGFIKRKAGSQLGFRTSDFFRGSKFSGKGNTAKGKFNPSQFKIQHKGG